MHLSVNVLNSAKRCSVLRAASPAANCVLLTPLLDNSLTELSTPPNCKLSEASTSERKHADKFE